MKKSRKQIICYATGNVFIPGGQGVVTAAPGIGTNGTGVAVPTGANSGTGMAVAPHAEEPLGPGLNPDRPTPSTPTVPDDTPAVDTGADDKTGSGTWTLLGKTLPRRTWIILAATVVVVLFTVIYAIRKK